MGFFEYMPEATKKRLYILATIIACTLGILLVLQLSKSTSNNVILEVAPSDATITMNGEKTSKGAKKLAVGNYTFTAAKSGYETTENIVKVDENTKDKKVRLILTPLSPDAVEYANNHPDEFVKLEEQAGDDTAKEGEDFKTKFPISEVLPFKNLLFDIDYTTANTRNGFKLRITADSATDRAYAIKQIRNWGYEPGDYEIEFANLSNPLGSPN